MSIQSATVVVEKEFPVDPNRMFRAWLDPEKIARWMTAPGGGKLVHAKVEACEGGHFSFLIHREGVDIEHAGEYRVFERPHRLAFTWGVPSLSSESALVTVRLEAAGIGTKVTLTAEGVAPEYAERTKRGWETILEAVAKA